MTTAGVHEIRSNNLEDENPQPIVLPAIGQESYGCLRSCWYLLSWVLSLVLHTVECFVTVWVAYTYADNASYIPFGISLAYLVVPQVILVTLSLAWYYNLDRYHRKKKENDPHNLGFIEYRKKFTPGAVFCHVILLGMVYRYAQLIYLVMIRKTNNVPFLRRDTTLLRLIHTLLVSAPLVILHLYVILEYLPNCLASDRVCMIYGSPSVYAALGSSLATLLYSILAFATNDRLSGKNRRVILPAHFMQIFWLVCMLFSRMLAIALFAFAHGYYVFAFLGGHWIIMFLFLLIQRTTFCADVIEESNAKIKVKRRWCLEIPFVFVAATIYIFTFINFRRGKTRYWAGFYHLLMYAEIATMGALFYIRLADQQQFFIFSTTTLTLTLGLYPVGMLFMVSYYLFFHPNKTSLWSWLGLPKSGSHKERPKITKISSPLPNGQVTISGPTLVAHNGFIPRAMLPDDVPSTPGDQSQMITNPSEIIEQTRPSAERTEDWVVPPMATIVSGHNYAVTPLTIVSPHSTGKSTTVGSDSGLPAVMSDRYSLIGQSDLDTDISSGVLHVPQGEIKLGDTVIDTPLFGNTPDPMQQMRLKIADRANSETLQSLTDTVDTGIDLGPDTPLTQGTNDPQDGDELSSEFFTRNRENMSLGLDIDLPQFSDIPAKRNSYIAKKSSLESHYFPEHQSRESQTPTLPAPSWGYQSFASKPVNEKSEKIPQFRTKGSGYQCYAPERSRRSTPRSPKGARAFTIQTGDKGKSPVLARNRNSLISSYPVHETYQQHSPRPLAPRSPKGARRMQIMQPSTSKSRPEPLEVPTNRHSFTNPAFISSRSPERNYRSVLNYQRQPLSSRTPDGRRRNLVKPQPVQKSNSVHVPMRSPERQHRRTAGHRQQDRPPTNRHSQYIQQQQEYRSRWDKWAAEQEEKRRQAKIEARHSYSHQSPKRRSRANVTHSFLSTQPKANIPRNVSEEFDHLEPLSTTEQSSTDGASSINQSASVAPQGYPRAPQGARGSEGPQFGWSTSRSDRLSVSPQRSILSANIPGAVLLQQNLTEASHREPQMNSFRMSAHFPGGNYDKFYAPTRSMHQSVV